MPNFTNPMAKTQWTVRGLNFAVQIVAWKYELSEGWMWNVYAYIYAKHRLFDQLDQTKTYQDSILDEMPLHCGPSLCVWLTDQGATDICSFKIGSDYKHLDDERFDRMSPSEGIPAEVRDDAAALFDWLTIYQGA